MTTFVPTNQIIGEYDTKQALQFLQGGTGLRISVGVLHGSRERRVMERDETQEDASEPSRWSTRERVSSGYGRKKGSRWLYYMKHL